MTDTTCSDALWACVMKSVVERHPDSASYWRFASNSQSDCSLCAEQGGGVLLKCCTDRCKKEYHLDCAFHEGGLSLDEDGILKFQCGTHFKPIVFCSCRQSYDESRGYICCDICCEWFHYTCVGLKDNSKLENFNCTTCLAATRQGKDMSLIKEKNLSKELLSSSHQTAIKALGALVEVSGSICPIIDQLSTSDANAENSDNQPTGIAAVSSLLDFIRPMFAYFCKFYLFTVAATTTFNYAILCHIFSSCYNTNCGTAIR